ncbi:NAD-dependent epimerase [Fodinibius saliphilus]|uniref:NAD-dependent epimerase n=1 Tax=Fodinibius saliphilus TaxID=1920650 RepID=UPI001108DD7F
MKILVTGAAGFIGFHLTRKLAQMNYQIVGLDCINDYYSTKLKYRRLELLGIHMDTISEEVLIESSTHKNISFIKADLKNRSVINDLFDDQKFDIVINLAAQAGVRHSLINPHCYIDSNITGFLNILEAARFHSIEHLIYASSSSVYGANTDMPFTTNDNVDHPMSLYAASKKTNELMAHTYSNLFDIPTTGLRFFTVYGPWGRPDMALFLFTKAILNGEPIKVFNYGKMERDFTYVGDIVEAIHRLIPKAPSGNADWSGDNPDPGSSFAPYQLFNIGNSNPVKLMDFISELEHQLGIKAEKDFLPMQPGDVPKTWADVDDLYNYIDFQPQVRVKEGIHKFVEWYTDYYLREKQSLSALVSK